MATAIYDEWNGLDFGHNGTTETYPLVASPGIHAFATDGNTLSGGFDGVAQSARWATAKRFTTTIGIRGTSVSAYRTNRAAYLAATASTEVGEYVVHDGDDTYTYFARVVDRDMPRDAEGEVFHNVEASITFEVLDGKYYKPTETLTFTGTSDSEAVTSDGWAASERWVWTVPGPVTNPQISSNLHAGATVRYVGTIADGYTLVVELLPRGSAPGYYAKVVTDANVATYRTAAGTNAYPFLDAGASYSGQPPGWFAFEPGAQTISYAATSGTLGSTLVWREAFA